MEAYEIWELIVEFFTTERNVFGVPGLRLDRILVALLIIALGRFLIRTFQKQVLNRILRRREVDAGRQYTISRLVEYVGFVLVVLLAIRVSNVADLTSLWLGSAALLVGVGLGLQQTFNDFFSGLIILLEGTVEVGDVVVVDNIVGRVKKIGLRTSMVTTRDNVVIIIPNSHLVVDNVVNWTHDSVLARFQVGVGVAYGSDLSLVKKILLQAADEHDKVLDRPEPSVMFLDFGNSSLDFQLHFFSKEFFRIEVVKSDIRFRIDERFREHGVEIPFPQRDLWLRNPETLPGQTPPAGSDA